eukprot:gene9368-10343_t
MADKYKQLSNLGTDLLKKVVPPGLYQQIRNALLFRAEDPNNLHQITPQMKVVTGVERIKGFRHPSPGSQPTPRIPVRESLDEVYDTSHYTHDHRNLRTNNVIGLHTSQGEVKILPDKPHLPSHGKRKITLLPYDPTGLRTTKTTTWEALDKALEKVVPNHLPAPEWLNEFDKICEEREAKGLPAPLGRRMKLTTSADFNEVRW